MSLEQDHNDSEERRCAGDDRLRAWGPSKPRKLLVGVMQGGMMTHAAVVAILYSGDKDSRAVVRQLEVLLQVRAVMRTSDDRTGTVGPCGDKANDLLVGPWRRRPGSSSVNPSECVSDRDALVLPCCCAGGLE